MKPSLPHSPTSVAQFEFPAIFCLYNFVSSGEGTESPRAVGMLGWLFEMNNYLAVAQLLLFVK